MKCMDCCFGLDKKLRKALILGVAAAGACVLTKKIIAIAEDNKLARFYEDEIEEIFREKENMKYHEDEFTREEEMQEKKEEQELQEAIKQFNEKRLKREERKKTNDID